MKREVVIAGFGGQGLLFAGEILAHAAMLEGLEVTWMPSYGPQMRGGTANCTVIVSDRPVRSPIVRHPTDVIALNQPSVDKFVPNMRANGVLVVNASMARWQPSPENGQRDIRAFEVAASQIAERLGNVRVANVVTLGTYVGVTRLVSLASIEAALTRVIPDSRANLRALNVTAFQQGMDIVDLPDADRARRVAT